MSLQRYTITLPWFYFNYVISYDPDRRTGQFMSKIDKVTGERSDYSFENGIIFTIPSHATFEEDRAEQSPWFFTTMRVSPFTKEDPFYIREDEVHLTKANAHDYTIVLRGPNATDLNRILSLYTQLDSRKMWNDTNWYGSINLTFRLNTINFRIAFAEADGDENERLVKPLGKSLLTRFPHVAIINSSMFLHHDTDLIHDMEEQMIGHSFRPSMSLDPRKELEIHREYSRLLKKYDIQRPTLPKT